jgi:hypothetical protein
MSQSFHDPWWSFHDRYSRYKLQDVWWPRPKLAVLICRTSPVVKIIPCDIGSIPQRFSYSKDSIVYLFALWFPCQWDQGRDKLSWMAGNSTSWYWSKDLESASLFLGIAHVDLCLLLLSKYRSFSGYSHRLSVAHSAFASYMFVDQSPAHPLSGATIERAPSQRYWSSCGCLDWNSWHQ